MARKKQRRHTSRRRSRGVHGTGSSGFMGVLTSHVLPIGAGLILASKIMDVLPESVQVYGKYLKIAGGGYLAATQKGMVGNAGLGLAVSGLYDVAKEDLHLISGVSGYLGAVEYPMNPKNFVSGTNQGSV